MVALGEQAISQANGLDSFIVINGQHLPAGLFLEFAENGFCVNLILGAVGDNLRCFVDSCAIYQEKH